MTADVTEIRRHQAYCIDCLWWGSAMGSVDAADAEADDHDMEWHTPGGEVE